MTDAAIHSAKDKGRWERFRESDFYYNFKRSPVAMASFAVVCILVLSAVFAPLIAPTNPFDPASLNLMNGFTAPMEPNAFTQETFLLGTDDQGRDVFSTILYGMRISLFVGVSAVLFAMVLGVVLGLVSGYVGGWTETIIMRTADVQLTFPSILVAMLIFGIAKGFTPVEYRDQMAIWVLILAIGLSDWVQFARVVRGATLVEKEKDYVAAARLIGRNPWAIMIKHILPNAMSPVLVIATISLALAIIAEATLSFLGVGRTPHAAIAGHFDPHWPRFPLFRRMVDPVLSCLHTFGPGIEHQSVGRLAARRFESEAALTASVLSIRNLSVDIPTRQGIVTPVDGVSYDIARGEILGVVGESGAGKSMAGNAVIGLLNAPAHISGGEIWLNGARIDPLEGEAMRKLRGKEIGMIFQDPLTSLNPLLSVGDQLAETMQTHLPLSRADAMKRAVVALDEVGIPGAAERINSYPHEFSGGMRQRVVIALALCAEPSLVIADEPTTALDVSVQAQIIALLKRLCRDRGTAVMLITHDMGVIAEAADRVAVMYAGRLAELGGVREVLTQPQHPYTYGLMASTPLAAQGQRRLHQIPGAMPRLSMMPEGCAFHPRCPRAAERCRSKPLPSIDGTRAACWFPMTKEAAE